MEHQPWIGSQFEQGIDGQKVLIIGFSHWGNVANDQPSLTIEVVGEWAQGNENAPFCPRLRSYFGNQEPSVFWQRVAFANSLPTLVGEEDERYLNGTKEQREAVPSRALHLVETLRPSRIFVFSSKAWRLWPDYTGSLKDGTLQVEGVGEYDAGTYKHADGEAIAFGFPHPQFTPTEPTKLAVAAAMQATVDTLRPTNDHI